VAGAGSGGKRRALSAAPGSSLEQGAVPCRRELPLARGDLGGTFGGVQGFLVGHIPQGPHSTQQQDTMGRSHASGRRAAGLAEPLGAGVSRHILPAQFLQLCGGYWGRKSNNSGPMR
jgi:hypothetical protein